jgi:O-6-methylguanine DNA methyltransferase
VANVDVQSNRAYGKIRQVTITAPGQNYRTTPLVQADGLDARAQAVQHMAANGAIVVSDGTVDLYAAANLEVSSSAGQVTQIEVTNSGVGYSALAAAMGEPKATRAVARACAQNPVSLAVPCHRVVGKDGDVTGYRWGVARKRALLAGEKGA